VGNSLLQKTFREEYARRVPTKLDMGASCIRFKNLALIPYDLIAELCRKFTVEDHIRLYEQALSQRKSKS